ncbi:MAG: tetratricopeptide repeat protein [Bacteroidales bacterium]
MKKGFSFSKICILIGLFLLTHLPLSAQIDTADVRRLMNEGLIRLQNRELRQAIQIFDQGREMLYKFAVELDERNQNLITSHDLTRQAERLIQQGNLEQALDLLNEAIALNDQNIEAYKFRGSIRLTLEQRIERVRDRDYIGLINDYTNAIRIVDRKIGTTPRNSQERKELEKERAKILINRAYVKMQSNRTPGFYSAIDDYTDAIRNDDQNWDGFLGRAVAYNKIREYRREVNDLLKAIELMQRYEFRMTDREWSELYLTVAMAYANLRDSRNAYDYAQRAYNLGNLEAERIMNRNRP